jgi:UDP-GlcNAc:undecaprenyl-phosphate GlcNAc-1-phosphate transferase
MNFWVFVGVAFVLTASLAVVLRPLAVALGLVDRPSGRKIHAGDIPLIGGIAIFLGTGIALLAYVLLTEEGKLLILPIAIFLVAGFILLAVGIWDDLRDLPPVVRFIAQVLAALLMILGGGPVIRDLGMLSFSDTLVSTGVLAVPFTVFVTVGIINAINMSDGLDGLCGNLTMVSLLGLGTAASLWGDSADFQLINIFSAAVAGFLIFNQRMVWQPRALIFLGDAGSMLLGFVLAWFTIEISQPPIDAVSPAAALWFVALPVMDTVGVMLRRMLSGLSPFHADSQHLHHLLIQAGFSVAETLLLLGLCAVGGITVGLLGTWFEVPDLLLAGLFLVTGIAMFTLTYSSWQRRSFLGRPLRAPTAAASGH